MPVGACALLCLQPQLTPEQAATLQVEAAGYTVSPLLPKYTVKGESSECLVTVVMKVSATSAQKLRVSCCLKRKCCRIRCTLHAVGGFLLSNSCCWLAARGPLCLHSCKAGSQCSAWIAHRVTRLATVAQAPNFIVGMCRWI